MNKIKPKELQRPLTRSLYMRKESPPLRCCTKIIMKTFKTNTNPFLYIYRRNGITLEEGRRLMRRASFTVMPATSIAKLYRSVSPAQDVHCNEIPVFCVRPRNVYALFCTCRYFQDSTVIMIQ